jgi:hypothetical protein
MADLERAQDIVADLKGPTPTEKKRLTEIIKTEISNIRKPGGKRIALLRSQMAQYRPVPLTLLSLVGGAVAEPIRRNIVGRLTSSCAGQAAGLLVLGSGLQLLGNWKKYPIPVIGPVGAAHVSYAGVLLAVSLYGTKKNPDALKLAIEGTSYKALHPAPKDDEAAEES